MATDDQFINGTINAAFAQGDDMARFGLLAAGFNPNDLGKAAMAMPRDPYNGGLYARRVSRLQKGDLLFHFSDSKCLTPEARFSGPWWFDRECFVTIRSIAVRENSGFTDTARAYLAVLGQWNDMKNLVGGILTAEFWCFKGLSGAVAGPDLNLSGPMRTDVMQIYVPGGLKLENFSQTHDDVLTSGIV